ncbi:hypothetical protein SteCoe_36015 [Stentor coeruleus]|uniref:EF-hand domain-containing protein n=1 Tax=Stentor coeruleus TaxID=5963 RepID=A0A1R2AR04_9CILI|nr:hypothetical protein SteCoe_36015 [Stentor coeruleus]
MHIRKKPKLKLIKSNSQIEDFALGFPLSRSTKAPSKMNANNSCKLPSITRNHIKKSMKCHQISMGSMSLIKSESATINKNKLLLHRDLQHTTRNKLKIKTTHWLISNYRNEVEKLLENCKLLIQNANIKGSISHQEFEDFMNQVGLYMDKFILDRLFWIFDDNRDGKIEPKEVIVGLEMFRQTNFKEKLEVFFDLCDEDGSGDIDEEEFFNVLKLCVSSTKERKLLKESLHELFMAIDEDGNGVLTKDEIIKASSQSETVKTIIEKSIMTCNGVDNWIANDFHNTSPILNFSNARFRENGLWYNDLDALATMVEENEKIYENAIKRREGNIKLLEHWKQENNHSELSIEPQQKEVIFGANGQLLEY